MQLYDVLVKIFMIVANSALEESTARGKSGRIRQNESSLDDVCGVARHLFIDATGGELRVALKESTVVALRMLPSYASPFMHTDRQRPRALLEGIQTRCCPRRREREVRISRLHEA